MRNAGWILSALVALFLIAASVVPKLIGAGAALDSMTALGWPTHGLFALGMLELVLVILYLIPRTGLLGAILLTGLLGGAMASHIRVDSPLWSHTLFSIYLGVFIWSGLLLRDAALRAYVRQQFPGRGSRP